jgi:hypothetical protein
MKKEIKEIKKYIVKYLQSCGMTRDDVEGEGVIVFRKESDFCELVAEDIGDYLSALYDINIKEKYKK